MDEGPLIYREEVTAIIGALADIVVDVHFVRDWLERVDGEEEGNEERDD